jgi:excisionase family DNA binding protein
MLRCGSSSASPEKNDEATLLYRVLQEDPGGLNEEVNMETKDYSRRTAAARLAVSEQTIDRLLKAGEIEAFHVGRRVVIPARSLDEYVARCQAAVVVAGETMKEKDR